MGYYTKIRRDEWLIHGWISKTLCWAKEVEPLKIYIMWFHLCEVLEQNFWIHGERNWYSVCLGGGEKGGCSHVQALMWPCGQPAGLWFQPPPSKPQGLPPHPPSLKTGIEFKSFFFFPGRWLILLRKKPKGPGVCPWQVVVTMLRRGKSLKQTIKGAISGTSLVVQWLTLQASTAGGAGLIPFCGTKILQAEQQSQKKLRMIYSLVTAWVTLRRDSPPLSWRELLKWYSSLSKGRDEVLEMAITGLEQHYPVET